MAKELQELSPDQRGWREPQFTLSVYLDSSNRGLSGHHRLYATSVSPGPWFIPVSDALGHQITVIV